MRYVCTSLPGCPVYDYIGRRLHGDCSRCEECIEIEEAQDCVENTTGNFVIKHAELGCKIFKN